MKLLFQALLLLGFMNFGWTQEHDSIPSETEDYSEYLNQISPPPPKISSVDEFNIIACDDCSTAKEKKLYFDDIVLSLFNSNITQDDLFFLSEINLNNRLREYLFFEFDLDGKLIKDRTDSHFTYKKESEIIDSIIIQFPKIRFYETKIDSTLSTIRYGVKIDYDIIKGDDKQLTLKHSKFAKPDAVGFASVDNPPVYIGCGGELTSNTQLKRCTSNRVSQFIAKNYNISLAADLGLSPGKKRIFAAFTITKTGEIAKISARAPHPTLGKEAKRVIQLLPKFEKPGYHGGEPVDVRYSLPIVFQIAD